MEIVYVCAASSQAGIALPFLPVKVLYWIKKIPKRIRSRSGLTLLPFYIILGTVFWYSEHFYQNYSNTNISFHFQVIFPELSTHHHSISSNFWDFHCKSTGSYPVWYDPQVQNVPRVPPILNASDTESKVLYPTESYIQSVSLDVPVKFVILGSRQVGKSALALRYLTKHECDPDSRRKGKMLSYWLLESRNQYLPQVLT